MVELTAAYAVGLSVFSVYVLKLLFEAWGVWKRHGLMALYFPCGISHVKLGPSVI